ncbi:MAG: SecE/Sec61-gamma subunit of protein translocation complex [Gaiellaceae bacterium]|nr:SecE/Sec61-gamma subunit of protein translocation complex [Gaiellaceae bacterium]
MAIDDETAPGGQPADPPRSAAASRRAARSAASEREVSSASRGKLHFVHECIAELRRVAWPDRAHLWQATLVVIVAVVIVGTYLYALDSVFKPLAGWVADKQAG